MSRQPKGKVTVSAEEAAIEDDTLERQLIQLEDIEAQRTALHRALQEARMSMLTARLAVENAVGVELTFTTCFEAEEMKPLGVLREDGTVKWSTDQGRFMKIGHMPREVKLAADAWRKVVDACAATAGAYQNFD